MQRSDTELVLAWSRGEQTAGGVLIERHFDAVLRFFRHKVRRAALTDLVQQTFLACVEARHRFRGESSFRTFLFQIARNQLYAHYRKSEQDAFVDATVTCVRDLRTSPTGLLSRQDDERILLEALQALPLELQLVLELTFWESMKVADVATVLEIAESTAYARVHRATALLSQHLRDAGIVVDAKVWSVSGDTLAAWMHSIRPPDVAGMADGH